MATERTSSSGSPSISATLRVLHLSDTHNMHRSIETTFGTMPEADILIHTGDFTNDGTDAEFEDFHSWLMEIKGQGKYPLGIYVIPGNHEWRKAVKGAHSSEVALDALRPDHMQKRLPGVKVLHHETVNIQGLTIYGSPWEPWHISAEPENGPSNTERNNIFRAKEDPNIHHRYHEIPPNTHFYLTHGPPRGLLDCIGNKQSWGSSRMMRYCIQKMQPQVHCFGHLHENRGYYWKNPKTGEFEGGVEYERRPGEGKFQTVDRPPKDYPCQLISNNAMSNHHRLEEVSKPYIKGPPRLIYCYRQTELYDPSLTRREEENGGGKRPFQPVAPAPAGEGVELPPAESTAETKEQEQCPTTRNLISDWLFTLQPLQ